MSMWNKPMSATFAGPFGSSIPSPPLRVLSLHGMPGLAVSSLVYSPLPFIFSDLPSSACMMHYSLHTDSITFLSLPLSSLLYPPHLCSVSLFYPFFSFHLFSFLILSAHLFCPNFSCHLVSLLRFSHPLPLNLHIRHRYTSW